MPGYKPLWLPFIYLLVLQTSTASSPRALHTWQSKTSMTPRLHQSLHARWTWAVAGSMSPAATQLKAQTPSLAASRSSGTAPAPDKAAAAAAAASEAARHSKKGFANAAQPSSAPLTSPGKKMGHSTENAFGSNRDSIHYVGGEETLREPVCLTESNYQDIADSIAGDERNIILTTLDLSFRGGDHTEEQLSHMKNFAYHLNQTDRLRSTLTVSYTEETCRLLLSVGIPCFLDRISARPETLPARLQEETPFYLKYWHALALLKLGINVYFSDSDAAILQDPFAFQDRKFDIEGLSDWNDRSIVPDPQGMFEHPCIVYNTAKDRTVHGGQFVDGYWHHPLSSHNVQKHMNPCQSTGGWFAQPTQPAMLFLADLLHWMTKWHPDQWDQAAWNELIMPHLFGTGSRAQLAYRLLPMDTFSNFKVNALRTKQRLPINQVVLHAGEAHGKRKVQEFKKRGLWRAADWQSQAGLDVSVKWGLAANASSCSSSARSKGKTGNKTKANRLTNVFTKHWRG